MGKTDSGEVWQRSEVTGVARTLKFGKRLGRTALQQVARFARPDRVLA